VCVGEAALVLSVEGDEVALVALRRGPRHVPLIAVTSSGETVSPGDWLLVQAGLAVARVSAAEAAQRNALGVDHV
jgi:hydrogenase maturation factor